MPAYTSSPTALLHLPDYSSLPSFQPPTPTLTPLFRLQCTVSTPPLLVGQTGSGQRAVVPITGATLLDPPALRQSSALTEEAHTKSPWAGARLLPGGADYFITGSDGVTRLDARYSFLLRSGHIIYIQSHGTRFTYSPTDAPLLLQQDLPPEKYYFRLNLTLESDDPNEELQLACKSLVVASAVRGVGSVVYDAYRLT